MSHETTGTFGLLAEYETPGQLMKAAEQIRDAGFKKWDCHTPFPVHGLDDAMGLGSPKLPWVVMGAGATGTVLAVLLQWWTNASDYRILISGKPMWSIPANIPIIFEVTVLLSALAAFGCLFAFNSLPQFFHPTFRSARFKRATTDRFFIVVEAADPQFDMQKTQTLLQSTGADFIETLEA